MHMDQDPTKHEPHAIEGKMYCVNGQRLIWVPDLGSVFYTHGDSPEIQLDYDDARELTQVLQSLLPDMHVANIKLTAVEDQQRAQMKDAFRSFIMGDDTDD